MKASRILAALALALTLAPIAAPAATTDASDLRMPATLGAPPRPDDLNPGERKRIERQTRAEWSRRTDAYRTWFSRKYGHDPSARQIHAWYERAYGVLP